MNISIHALREEGDRSSTTKAPTGTISIHALREEGDQWDANVDQLARENEKLRAAQGQVDQSTAASGTISAALREAIVAEAIKSIKEGDKHENA